jgi:hypothetical protein
MPYAKKVGSEERIWCKERFESRWGEEIWHPDSTGVNPPDWRELETHAGAHNYVRDRGVVTHETMDHFCVSGDMPDRVVIPIIEDGVLVAWQARALEDENGKRLVEPKYVSGATKDGWLRTTECVWGLDRMVPGEHVWVCEGIFDALYFPQGVAIHGSSASEIQILKVLDRMPSSVTVVLDIDDGDTITSLQTRGLTEMERWSAYNRYITVDWLAPEWDARETTPEHWDFGELLERGERWMV